MQSHKLHRFVFPRTNSTPLLFGLALATLYLFLGASTPSPAIITYAQESSIPSYENPPTNSETYSGSGAYLLEPNPAINSAIQISQQRMVSSGVDLSRLVGLRLGDMLLKLSSGQAKRVVFYERGGYHELNGIMALGSLVLTSLKDGRLVLGTDTQDYYTLTGTQVDYLLRQPVAGEGSDDTLTLGGLLRAGTFDNTPILNVDPAKAPAVLAKYEGKLVTEGFARGVDEKELQDPNFAQQMLPTNSATGMSMPVQAHDALLRLFSNNESLITQLVGLPVSPYFVIETKVNGVLKKIGVLMTERQMLTYNPDNSESDRWQIGLFGSRLYDTIRNAPAPPTATPTITPSSTVTPIPTATTAPTPVFAGISYDHPLPEMPWFAGFDLDVKHYPDMQPIQLSDPRKLALMVLTMIAHQQRKDLTTLEQELTTNNGKLDSFLSFHKIRDTYIAEPRGNHYIPGSLVEKRSAPLDLGKKIMITESAYPPLGGEVLTLNAPFFSPGVQDGQLSFYMKIHGHCNEPPSRGAWNGWELADQAVIGKGLEYLAHVNDYSWPDKEATPYLNYQNFGPLLFPPGSFDGIFTPWGAPPGRQGGCI